MILLYLFTRFFLALVHALVRGRVGRLERRYVRLAAKADTLLKASSVRGGTNKTDGCLAAKQQYELALAALKRDRVEGHYASWQTFSERFARLRRGLASYRGRAVPYLFGLADVGGALALLNRFEVSPRDVLALVGL